MRVEAKKHGQIFNYFINQGVQIMTKDMTMGSPLRMILLFSVPVLLGNIFQQFYTMADTMIVGQVVGVKALAAVGAGDWLVWLVLGIMTGITQGFSILVSQYYGAREKENLKCAVAKSYIMTALLSVIVLAVSEGAVYHVLLFLQTPDNVIDLTMLYLRLIFAGVPIIAAYNIFAAILRALGNSRSPLIAMTVAAGSIHIGLSLPTLHVNVYFPKSPERIKPAHRS